MVPIKRIQDFFRFVHSGTFKWVEIFNAGLILCLARLLQRIVAIRVIEVDSGHIGHIVKSFGRLPEWHAQTHQHGALITLVSHNFVSNRSLLKVLSRSFGARLEVRAGARVRSWQERCCLAPTDITHDWLRPPAFGEMTITRGRNDLKQVTPLIRWPVSFLDKDSQLWRKLRQISQERPVVCLHVRDAAYKKYYMWRVPNSAHESSEEDWRNATVMNFESAVRALVELGYFVVRVGNRAAHRMNLHSPFFWDYPFSKMRDAAWDTFLPFASTFFVAGANSGYVDVASLSETPILHLNYTPAFNVLVNTYQGSSFSLKHHVDSKTGERLSLREIHKRLYGVKITPAHFPVDGQLVDYFSSSYSSRGIAFRENSSLEILDCVMEFESNLKNKVRRPLSESQRAFNDLYFVLTGQNLGSDFSISRSFLDRNLHLLS